MSFTFQHPYTFSPEYAKPVAYFCMEYAIHQSLKLYAGGLGFLAGSHLRSAYEMKQNLVGIGILWKYGYYDQVRKSDQTMDVLFQEKVYGFLQKTDIRFAITVSGHPVWVTAYFLPPGIFNTAPLFLLSTDVPENDYLSKTICHRLYDSNPETKIAASILLGVGGAMLLEQLNWLPAVYHLNESHALPLAFYLYRRCNSLDGVKAQLVFTNHTPEESGNARTDMGLLEKMGFFCGIPLPAVKTLTQTEEMQLDHTLTAFRFAGRSNAVSALHRKTLGSIWQKHPEVLQHMIAVTNAQNFRYWANKQLYKALDTGDDGALRQQKLAAKEALFELVADQNGEIFRKEVLTIVFAKRFAGYKRADLLLHDPARFEKIVGNREYPVQLIWAGKPYPMDYTAIGVFDKIVHTCKQYSNCAILTGYEMQLSKLLKQGADVWLNVPRLTHEASGTSGMTAAMNGAINLGTADGWFPEFAKDGINGFVIPPANTTAPDHLQDEADAGHLYDLLEHTVIPLYYNNPAGWLAIMKNSMYDIVPQFDSNRMVADYYRLLYNPVALTQNSTSGIAETTAG